MLASAAQASLRRLHTVAGRARSCACREAARAGNARRERAQAGNARVARVSTGAPRDGRQPARRACRATAAPGRRVVPGPRRQSALAVTRPGVCEVAAGGAAAPRRCPSGGPSGRSGAAQRPPDTALARHTACGTRTARPVLPSAGPSVRRASSAHRGTIRANWDQPGQAADGSAAWNLRSPSRSASQCRAARRSSSSAGPGERSEAPENYFPGSGFALARQWEGLLPARSFVRATRSCSWVVPRWVIRVPLRFDGVPRAV